MRSGTRIDIARELFKFSCAHMTVFPDGTKERLHGHNYFAGVALELRSATFAQMIPFAPIKASLAELCQTLREHVLLAEHNPFFKMVSDSDVEIEFRLCGERYVLPRQDVLLLPIDNVTVEALAAYLTDQLLGRLDERVLRMDMVRALEIRVTESPGQGATYTRVFE